MPIRARLDRLPSRIRAELHRRLLDSAFGDPVKIAAWLTQKGHPIRKSSLGNYVVRNRAAIEAAAARKASPSAARTEAAIRIACLQASVSAGTGRQQTRVILERAERFVGWVQGTSPTVANAPGRPARRRPDGRA